MHLILDLYKYYIGIFFWQGRGKSVRETKISSQKWFIRKFQVLTVVYKYPILNSYIIIVYGIALG